jgi:hypothetical protein
MSVEGVDYSYDRPSPVCLASSGKAFAVRYFSLTGSSKNLTPSEANSVAAAGLWLCTVWQEHGDFSESPTSAGASAVSQAKACKMPSGRPIYAAADFDAQPSQYDSISNWLKQFGAAIAPYQIGLYGSGALCAEMLKRQAVQWTWQTYAWSGGAWNANANMQQYKNDIALCGAQVDLDRGMTADYGQWKPGITPATGDDEVTDDDLNKIAQKVWAYMVGNGGAGATLEEVRSTNRDMNAKLSKLCDPRNGNVNGTG